MPSHPCLLFALAREHLFVPHNRPIPNLPVRAWHGAGDAVIVETGIGVDNVRRALDAILPKFPPAWLIFAGFGGALASNLNVGDVVAASEVRDEAGIVWKPTHPLAMPSARFLTTPRLIGDPEEKQRLAKKAEVVDMESVGFAQVCQERNLPWACVRAISDDCQASLSPELISLMSGGRVALGKVLLALARRPTLLGELLRLGRDTKIAARALGRFAATR